MTERLVLAAATLLLAGIGLLPVAAMLKETLIADGRFSLDAYRALLQKGVEPPGLDPTFPFERIFSETFDAPADVAWYDASRAV